MQMKRPMRTMRAKYPMQTVQTKQPMLPMQTLQAAYLRNPQRLQRCEDQL
jgi:hypothetical protein